MQVVDQGREAAVELGQLACPGSSKILAWWSQPPQLTVTNRTPRLDQPPGQQAALAEGVAAVAVAEACRSPASMAKALRASLDRTIVGGPLLELVVGRDLVVALDLLRQAVDGLQQRLAALGRLGVERLGGGRRPAPGSRLRWGRRP